MAGNETSFFSLRFNVRSRKYALESLTRLVHPFITATNTFRAPRFLPVIRFLTDKRSLRTLLHPSYSLSKRFCYIGYILLKIFLPLLDKMKNYNIFPGISKLLWECKCIFNKKFWKYIYMQLMQYKLVLTRVTELK